MFITFLVSGNYVISLELILKDIKRKYPEEYSTDDGFVWN